MTDADFGRPGGPSSAAPIEPVPVSPLRASVPDAGDWVVYKKSDFSGLLYRHAQVGKVTAKQVRLVAAYWDKVIPRSDVVAVFSTKKEAEAIREAIGGAYGEYNRRRRKADAIRGDAVKAARIAFERQVSKLIAQGIEARSDETAQQAQPEGQEPDPKGCARPTPSHSED